MDVHVVEQEVTFEQAYHALERWYWTVVREYVASYTEEREAAVKRVMKQEDLEDESDVDQYDVDEYMYEWLHETLDGCEEVIYTARSKAILLASPNEDAYLEEIGEVAETVNVAAMWALRRDISERVE